MRNAVPVLTVVAVIFALWYGAAVVLNAPWAYDKAARAEAERRTSESEAAAGRQSRRIEELERLLAHQAEENRDLLDELLKARIMRLRMERQMLQTKLADLADEKK